jgi:hypothetical protein
MNENFGKHHYEIIYNKKMARDLKGATAKSLMNTVYLNLKYIRSEEGGHKFSKSRHK